MPDQKFPLQFYGRIFYRTQSQLNKILELIELKGTKNNPTRYALARKIESLLEDIADYHFIMPSDYKPEPIEE